MCAGIVPLVAGAALGPTAAFAASSGHDSTVFAFGTASFKGSTQGMALNAPIVGMAPTANGKGYWLVANDGGVFGFNAPFFGSLGAMHLNAPIIGMAATPTGKGYWLVAQNGGVFNFGDAKDAGSGVHPLPRSREIIQITGVPGGGGSRLLPQPRPIIIAPPLGVGASGAAVVMLQQRLLDLGFWLPGVTGSY